MKWGPRTCPGGDTQEDTLIMLHPGGDWKESQTQLTTLFSHRKSTSERILLNCNVNQRRVFKMEKLPRWSSAQQGSSGSPCSSSSWMFYLHASNAHRVHASHRSWQDSPRWWLYCLRKGVLAQPQHQDPPPHPHPEQLVPPLNVQIVRELTSEEVAAENNPLRSRSNNDKTIYCLLSMFGFVGVEALSCVLLLSACKSVDLYPRCVY